MKCISCSKLDTPYNFKYGRQIFRLYSMVLKHYNHTFQNPTLNDVSRHSYDLPSKHAGYCTACLNIKNAAFAHIIFIGFVCISE
jgi:hypothetical protein